MWWCAEETLKESCASGFAWGTEEPACGGLTEERLLDAGLLVACLCILANVNRAGSKKLSLFPSCLMKLFPDSNSSAPVHST
jgi:hypothetical protein